MPERHLLNVNGVMYGTTTLGGGSGCRHREGCGTIFSIAPSGTEKVLYRFKGFPDGIWPDSGLAMLDGKLYGTTSKGGRYNKGTVFDVTPSGVEHILHDFRAGGSDGVHPSAGLTNVKGTLYGTTHGGGTHGEGAIFRITTAGKETVIYSFGTNSAEDGAWPAASLIERDGVLYGTSTDGGKYRNACYPDPGCGTVFEVTLSGTERVIYSFKGATNGDGRHPVAGLADVNGVLYGTTQAGGNATECDGFGRYPDYGCGIVFEVTTTGREKVLHRFTGGTDGAVPVAGLAYLNGTFYGTTSYGGAARCLYNGCGTIFKVEPSGKETVLYRFVMRTAHGILGGLFPEGGLTEAGGVLYGTTAHGGNGTCGSSSLPASCGTVYQINP